MNLKQQNIDLQERFPTLSYELQYFNDFTINLGMLAQYLKDNYQDDTSGGIIGNIYSYINELAEINNPELNEIITDCFMETIYDNRNLRKKSILQLNLKANELLQAAKNK
jgi:hypothetical protein